MKYISPSDPNSRLSVMVMVCCPIGMVIDVALIHYNVSLYGRWFAIASFAVLAVGMIFMFYSWRGYWRIEHMKQEREAIRDRATQRENYRQ